MGFFRYLLSLFVLLGHLKINVGSYFPGSMAVICFYLLSGYAMTKLIHKHYFSVKKIWWFYLDRFLRLYPQYFFYLFLSLLVYYQFIGLCCLYVSEVTLLKTFLNLLIVPLNVYWFFSLETASIIPQASSLGLEIIFYIILPWILLAKKYVILGTNFLSLFVAAVALTGYIDSDIFGYRLLPGVLWIFLLGSWLAKKEYIFVGINYLFAIIGYYLILSQRSLYVLNWNKEIYLAVIITVPIIALLAHFSSKHLKKIDSIFGHISYGIFLNHILLREVLKHYIPDYQSSMPFVILMIVFSTLLGCLTYIFIEKPFRKIQLCIRNRYLYKQDNFNV